MQLDIPFFSQLDNTVPENIQRSVCAIACVKMLCDWKNSNTSFIDLYKEAEIIGGREVSGWNHETIVRLLRNHNLLAYRQEFIGHTINLQTLEVEPSKHSKDFEDKGIEKIKKEISENKPVIVSVFAGFSQDAKNKKSINMVNHIVLITGFDEDSLFVHDPIFDTSTKVSWEHFLKFWRRLAIFVE